MKSSLLLALSPLLLSSATTPPADRTTGSLTANSDCVEIERTQYEVRSGPLDRPGIEILTLTCPGPPILILNLHYPVTNTFVKISKFESVTTGYVGPSGPPIPCASTVTLLSVRTIQVGQSGEPDIPQEFIDCMAEAGECCYTTSIEEYETVTPQPPTQSTVTEDVLCPDGEQTYRKVTTTTTTKERVTEYRKTEYSRTGADGCDSESCEEEVEELGTRNRVKSTVTHTTYPDGICL